MPWSGGGGRAKGSLLWEWNGVDTSQFETPFIALASGASAGTRSQAIVAGALGSGLSAQPGGNVLALSTSGSGGSGLRFHIFPLKVALPQRYEVEMFSDYATYNNDLNNGTGFVTMADPDFNHGYIWHQGGRRARLDGGVVQPASLQGTVTTQLGVQLTLRVEGRPGPFTDYAHFQHDLFLNRLTTEDWDLQRSSFDANDGTWNLSSAGLPPGSWAGTEGNRFALMMFTLTNNQTWYISTIRIRSI